VLFTSESVTEGHPDKLADQISDAVLDAMLKQDPESRVACETAVSTGSVFVLGEITTDCYVEIPDLVRGVIKEVGYDSSDVGFDYKTCAVLTGISKQSPDIAQGVNNAEDNSEEFGAGDQGMMFGYATNESKDALPLSISYAHQLARKLAEVRKSGTVNYLRPDGKTQVTIEYDENNKPVRVDKIVVSTQHDPDVERDTIAKDVYENVITAVIPADILPKKDAIFVNPTGRFVHGGPSADCGLTGRKIIVDTYGGHGAHGGGAFSGKDPTKVDRSAAYMARYIAKNLVAAGTCDRVLVQLAYAIGRAQPVSINVNTYGTGKVPETTLVNCIKELMPLTPKQIISFLDLRRPIYRKIAAYGHFGVDPKIYNWEKTDKVSDIQTFCKLEKSGTSKLQADNFVI
jgi:S-adenosylmethionine synthetase